MLGCVSFNFPGLRWRSKKKLSAGFTELLPAVFVALPGKSKISTLEAHPDAASSCYRSWLQGFDL